MNWRQVLWYGFLIIAVAYGCSGTFLSPKSDPATETEQWRYLYKAAQLGAEERRARCFRDYATPIAIRSYGDLAQLNGRLDACADSLIDEQVKRDIENSK